MTFVSISDFLILDCWLPGKIKDRIKGAEHCRAWERKEWLMKLAIPEHALVWTFLVCPIAGLIVTGIAVADEVKEAEKGGIAMRVYEVGAEHEKTFAMFQCAAEPWWVFKASAEAVARDYHVFLFIADSHDELGTEFVSIEKNVTDAAAYLREKSVLRLDAMYGVSMGGASVIRFLATQDIPVAKAVIDAGITPYPYPKWICRLIAAKDWVTVMLGTKSYRMMKLAYPPERWTPKGEDSEDHYRRIFEFEKHHFSAKTIYRTFWSTNNYAMPDPVPAVDTEIEYWYGEEEKRARKNDLAYTRKAYPQTVPREFKGLAHAELVLMYPKRFYQEIMRFLKK